MRRQTCVGVGIPVSGRVTSVPDIDGLPQRFRDRWIQGYVHLSNPQWEQIGSVGLPLLARAATQLLEGKLLQRVRVPSSTPSSHLNSAESMLATANQWGAKGGAIAIALRNVPTEVITTGP